MHTATNPSLLPPPRIFQALLQHFLYELYRKALVLVRAADANDGPLPEDTTYKLRRALGLGREADLEILLACAEKLRHGMYFTMLGDPAKKEAQLLNILEGF